MEMLPVNYKRLFVVCSEERDKNNMNKIFICFQVLFYVVLRSFLVMFSVHFNLDFITFPINIIFFESSVCFFLFSGMPKDPYFKANEREKHESWK